MISVNHSAHIPAQACMQLLERLWGPDQEPAESAPKTDPACNKQGTAAASTVCSRDKRPTLQFSSNSKV